MARGKRSFFMRVVDLVVYGIVRLVLAIIQAMPTSMLEPIASVAGWFLGDILRVRCHVVDENLAWAFPDQSLAERRAIRRGMWRHLFFMLFEMALAHRKIHQTNWRDYVGLDGGRRLASLMLSERATVAVTAHHGNFELSGYMAGLFGFPTITLARPLDNPHLDHFIREFRQQTGQQMIDSSGTADVAQMVLEQGAALAILGDHAAGPKGCWVPFFGRPASCHKSVALFSLANRIPLMILVTVRDKRMLRFVMRCVHVYDPLTDTAELRGVPELTRWYNQQLETEIRRHPDQYWWLHRRWKQYEKTRPTVSV